VKTLGLNMTGVLNLKMARTTGINKMWVPHFSLLLREVGGELTTQRADTASAPHPPPSSTLPLPD
jgi:hypothetical protein